LNDCRGNLDAQAGASPACATEVENAGMTIKKMCAVTLGISSLGLASAASAQLVNPESLYFRAETGISWSGDADIRDRNFGSTPAICGDAACSTRGAIGNVGQSAVFSGAIGYRIKPNVRAELALGYRGGYDANTTMPNGATLSADVSSWNLMANAYYDFDLGLPVRPYLTGGLGWARNSVSDFTSVNPAGAAAGGSRNNLAWSLGAGIGYPINNRLTLDFGYRFVDLGRLATAADGGATLSGAPAPYSGAIGKLKVNELVLGVRW
jgi:outer membrane immunogenic protein